MSEPNYATHVWGTKLLVFVLNNINLNTAQEFSKTAEAVRAEPWGLTKAADYLTNLCNPTQGDPEPIKFNFFLNHKVITKLNQGRLLTNRRLDTITRLALPGKSPS